jgi:hypothetical protein
MRKWTNILQYMRRPLVIYGFATDPCRVSLYMRKIRFSFLSEYFEVKCSCRHYQLHSFPPELPEKGSISAIPTWHQHLILVICYLAPKAA